MKICSNCKNEVKLQNVSCRAREVAQLQKNFLERVLTLVDTYTCAKLNVYNTHVASLDERKLFFWSRGEEIFIIGKITQYIVNFPCFL